MLVHALSAAVAFESLFGAAAVVLFTQLAAFVVGLSSFGKAEFDLGNPAPEVKAKGNESVSTLLDFCRQAHDLLAMKEELAIALRIDVVDRAFFVRGDVNTLQDCLPIPNDRIPILKRALAVA